jgi:hypothetical protein
MTLATTSDATPTPPRMRVPERLRREPARATFLVLRVATVPSPFWDPPLAEGPAPMCLRYRYPRYSFDIDIKTMT